jgi:hypothetical protein
MESIHLRPPESGPSCGVWARPLARAVVRAGEQLLRSRPSEAANRRGGAAAAAWSAR